MAGNRAGRRPEHTPLAVAQANAAAVLRTIVGKKTSVLRGSRKTASNFEQALETWIEYSVCALTSLP